MTIKSKFMNYFKEGKLFQWDENKNIYTIINLENFDKNLEFCLAKKEMDKFLKYSNPKLTLGKQLRISSGKQWTNLQLANTELVIPDTNFINEVNVDIEKLKVATKFTAPNDKKPILTGVNVGDNCICSTDSFYAFKSEAESENGSITLTNDFINEIEADGIINIKYNTNLSYYIGNNIMIIGRLLDGLYPPVSKIYSKNLNGNEFKINFDDLNNLLQFFDNDKEEKEYIIFSHNKIRLESSSVTEIEIDLPIEIELVCAAKRLLTIIKQIKADELTFTYSGNDKPFFINKEFLLLPIVRR